MSEMLSLVVNQRFDGGKGPNRRYRDQGKVPCVFYDSNGKNIKIIADDLPLRKVYRDAGSTSVIQLEITEEGKTETLPCLIWKIHNHPFKNQILHVDFLGVNLEKEIKIIIPVEITGTPKGVKLQGGKLEVFRDHIEVVCLPLSIPDKITIDVVELEINHNINVQDLVLPEGVSIASDENFAVVGVQAPEAAAESEEAAEV